MASVKGLESTFLNVAGLAFVERNELAFANSMYLGGTGIALNSLGFATKVGGSGVLGLSVTSMSLGDIPITTEDLPEGGIGSFSPAFSNIGVTYSKSFSNSIYGGLTMRIVSESISNVRASGVCFDAGIRYVTGENDGLRFIQENDHEATCTKMAMISAVLVVISSGLGILGVEPATHMN